MSEFDGFVFDIDMTAVPLGALTVESSVLISSFEALPDDVIAIAATGRSIDAALPITRALNLRHESVLANGAMIVDSATGNIVWKRLVSKEQVSAVIEECLTDNYFVFLDGDNLDKVITTRASDQQPNAREVPVMFIQDVPSGEAEGLQKRLLAEVPGIHIYTTPAWSGNKTASDLNIGNIEAKKHNALLELFGRHAIDGSRMIGVGDGINDIELFEVVGHRIAVANAHPQLIKLADEVVPSQDNDGLAVVVKRFHRLV